MKIAMCFFLTLVQLEHRITSSDWADVTSAIPQGSVLRPTLFLIYINDLPDVVHNFVKLFADDAKLYAVVNTVDDAKTVQDDLFRIDNWSDIWQIRSNYKKNAITCT